ncbi:MAG: hypothetical protein HZC36_05685 [Armatimonadetes bacterium]|nr:hypothetical protein [Armatimonadota bacterium]
MEATTFDGIGAYTYAEGMASCYRCGKPITGQELRQRRQVYVGESFWTLYARRRQSSHRRHYGMRIVCSGCAAKLDWGRGAYRSPEARLRWFLTMIGLLLLFLAGFFAAVRTFFN